MTADALVPPRIARIDPVAGRPRCVSLVFADERAPRTTSARAVRALGLGPGDDLDEDALASTETRLAHERALELLAVRERSLADLTGRLVAEGYPERAVSLAVERLVGSGAIDDERFASQFARSRIRAGDAPDLIVARLRAHGVAADLARRTVAALAPDAYALALQALGTRRPLDEADRARLIRRLTRKGFDTGTAIRAVDARTEGGSPRPDDRPEPYEDPSGW